MKKFVFLGLCLLLFYPLNAFADPPYIGSASLGGHAARWEPKDLDDTIFFGLQVRFRISETFAVEGSLDYYTEELGNDADIIIYPVQASLLAYLISSRIIEVYLNAGAGWYYYEIDSPLLEDSGHEFGWHGGVGLELPLHRNFSLYADMRWVYFKPELEASDLDDIQDWYGLWTNIGFNVYF